MVNTALETTGQLAGIGGLALGIFFLLVRQLLAKNIFPVLKPSQGLRLLTLLVILAWSVAIGGLITYLLAKYLDMHAEHGSTKVSFEHSPGSIGIVKDHASVTIHQKSPLPALSDKNVRAVVESVFPEPSQLSIFTYKIVKSDQARPLLFLISDRNKMRHFSIIKNIEERWQIVWEYREDSPVFNVASLEAIVCHEDDHFIRSDLLVTFDGCFPHNCSDSWGLLVYNVKINSGWVVRCFCDANEPNNKTFKIDYPKEHPDDLWTLFKFETKLIDYVRGHINLKEPNGYTEALKKMPNKRIIPFLYAWGEVSEAVLSQLPSSLQNKQIERIFCVDADGDGSLEWVVVVDRPDDRRVLIAKNNDIFELREDEGMDAPLFIARYHVPGESPYLLLGGYAGSAGCPFGAVYRWDGTKYRLFPKMKELLMTEFKMQNIEKCKELNKPVTSNQ